MSLKRAVRGVGVAAVLAGGCLSAAPVLAGPAHAATTANAQTARPVSPASLARAAIAAAAASTRHDWASLPAVKYLSCTKSAKITGTFAVHVSGVALSFREWTAKDQRKRAVVKSDAL